VVVLTQQIVPGGVPPTFAVSQAAATSMSRRIHKSVSWRQRCSCNRLCGAVSSHHCAATSPPFHCCLPVINDHSTRLYRGNSDVSTSLPFRNRRRMQARVRAWLHRVRWYCLPFTPIRRYATPSPSHALRRALISSAFRRPVSAESRFQSVPIAQDVRRQILVRLVGVRLNGLVLNLVTSVHGDLQARSIPAARPKLRPCVCWYGHRQKRTTMVFSKHTRLVVWLQWLSDSRYVPDRYR